MAHKFAVNTDNVAIDIQTEHDYERCHYKSKVRVKISMLQAVEAPTVARDRGSDIT
jgi:hypothetical protein